MAGKSITIVGGGLAGLTLGIALRRSNVPVVVWESGTYPRHRVCGEFISGRGQRTLERLGLRDQVLAAGATLARTVAFFSPRARSQVREMPEPALSISRFALDALLADEFRRLGGDLRAAERWSGAQDAEGLVRATGRKLRSISSGWRWFGLKVHARNVPLEADLEMHLSPNSYLGMSWLKDGEVNICGLFRRPAASGADSAGGWREMLLGEPGSARHARLKNAAFDESSFCSVAGLSLTPEKALASPGCCVGDAITMIPPVTGNGMSMAFESAELACEPLAAYSAGKLPWRQARQFIARKCDEQFSQRLAWAALLQRLLFVPTLQDTLVATLPRWHWLWRALVARTR